MTDWKKVPLDEWPRCLETCERPEPYVSEKFGFTQWNCPRHYHVEYCSVVNALTHEACKMWKPKPDYVMPMEVDDG